MRPALFLSRFAIALWLVLISGVLSLLISQAPAQPNVPFAGLAIRTADYTIHFPNRIFTCDRIDSLHQCQTTLLDQPLKLTWAVDGFDESINNLGKCEATYGDRSVSCQATNWVYANGLQFIYEIQDDMGLSDSELRSLQQTYRITQLFRASGELGVLVMVNAVAIATGLCAALLAWLYPSQLAQGFVSLVCGFSISLMVRHGLGRVPFDVVTPYGITDDRWMWIVRTGAIAAGTVASSTTILLLWGRLNRWLQPLAIAITCAAVFNFCWLSLRWSLNYFGLYLQVLGHLIGSDFYNSSTAGIALVRTAQGLALLLAIAAAVLLWQRTRKSIRVFVTLSSGFGLFAVATTLFMHLVVGLGHWD